MAGSASLEPSFLRWFSLALTIASWHSFLRRSRTSLSSLLYPLFLYFLNTYIRSGSRGLTVLISLGTKLDIIFSMVSFRIATWRLGFLFPRLISHGYLDRAALIECSLARSKCQNFLEYLGGGGILKLILQKTILYLTVTSSDSRTPLFKQDWVDQLQFNLYILE